MYWKSLGDVLPYGRPSESLVKTIVDYRKTHKKDQANPTAGSIMACILVDAKYKGGIVPKLRANKVLKYIKSLSSLTNSNIAIICSKAYTFTGEVTWYDSCIKGSNRIPKVRMKDSLGRYIDLPFYKVFSKVVNEVR